MHLVAFCLSVFSLFVFLFTKTRRPIIKCVHLLVYVCVHVKTGDKIHPQTMDRKTEYMYFGCWSVQRWGYTGWWLWVQTVDLFADRLAFGRESKQFLEMPRCCGVKSPVCTLLCLHVTACWLRFKSGIQSKEIFAKWGHLDLPSPLTDLLNTGLRVQAWF